MITCVFGHACPSAWSRFTMSRLKKIFRVFFLFPIYLAGDIPLNSICNPALTRPDPATHKMMSDCDDKFFCNNGTCQWKRCRIFPQDTVYDPGDPVPPLCTQGTYCPDAQDTCKPPLPLGSSCELNRDGTRHREESLISKYASECNSRTFQTSAHQHLTRTLLTRRCVFNISAGKCAGSYDSTLATTDCCTSSSHKTHYSCSWRGLHY